jgi:hypothetical protein
MMAQCITCGTTLHPERAQKYNYCMARECQEKNAKALTMVAVGMNKAADEFLILDERTREDLASGKYRDQRRGTFGTSAPAPAPQAAPRATEPSGRSARRAQPQPLRRSPAPQQPAGSGPNGRKDSHASTTSKDFGQPRLHTSSA